MLIRSRRLVCKIMSKLLTIGDIKEIIGGNVKMSCDICYLVKVQVKLISWSLVALLLNEDMIHDAKMQMIEPT